MKVVTIDVPDFLTGILTQIIYCIVFVRIAELSLSIFKSGGLILFWGAFNPARDGQGLNSPLLGAFNAFQDIPLLAAG